MPLFDKEDIYLRSLFAHHSQDGGCALLFAGAQKEKELRGVEGPYHLLYVGCLLKSITPPKSTLFNCLPSFNTTLEEEESNNNNKKNVDNKNSGLGKYADLKLHKDKLVQINKCINDNPDETFSNLEKMENVVSEKPNNTLLTYSKFSSPLTTATNNNNEMNFQINENETKEVIKKKITMAVQNNCREEFGLLTSLNTQEELQNNLPYFMFKANICLYSSVCKRQFNYCLNTQLTHKSFAKCLEEKEQAKCMNLYSDVEFE
ncbi:hypothetical protein ABK040_014239 [Willaertia magna]